MNYTDFLGKLNTLKATRDINLLDDVISLVKEEIARDEAKKGGKLSALSAAKRILKSSLSDNLKYAFYQNDKQCICNSYELVILNEQLPLENRPESIEAPSFDVERLIKTARDNQITVELPTVAELKTQQKIQKANKERIPYYDFGEGLPRVQIIYLLDIMALLPNVKTVKISNRYSLTSAIYCNDNNGEAVIMPLKKV